MTKEERDRLQQWGWRNATPAVVAFALLIAFQVLIDLIPSR